MDLVTLCPFVVSKVVWQAHSGTFALTVVVKATFVLQPGAARLAPTQDPILDHDRFHDDDPRRSVRAPSDLVPYKPRADVMLVGHAYAAGKQPVRSLVTRFVVGDMDKSIEVWCDRAFRVLDGQLLEGKRFTQMPLVWERASGGSESANPIGKRFDGPADMYGTIAIANLQPLGHFVSKRSDTFVPTCYAPVGPSWPGRTQRLGHFSRGILDRAWNDKPLPRDLDPMFFQAAPPDQHVAEIRANERIVLDNMHPEHPHLVTSLPDLRPRAIADRATGEREEITLVGDTLWVDTDRSLCSVVWRGRIGLRHPQEAGRIAVWVDSMPIAGPIGTPQVIPEAPDVATTMIGLRLTNNASALPFVSGSSSLAQSDARNGHADENDGTGTMFVSTNKSMAKPIPFGHQGTVESRLEETIPPLPASSDSAAFVVPTAPVPPAFFQGPYAKERTPFVEPTIAEVPCGLVEESEVAKREEVAPPPMIGPLARGEMEQDKPATVAHEVRETAKEEKPAVEEVDDSDVVELSLEQTATIATELAEGHMERTKVLEAHELTERMWTKNEGRWEGALDEEQEHGKNALRAAYDAAYVKRVEGFRGTITVEDYTKLVVGMERGRDEAVLEELRIQEEALMPIMRIWAKKIAGDIQVAREVTVLMRGGRPA